MDIAHSYPILRERIEKRCNKLVYKQQNSLKRLMPQVSHASRETSSIVRFYLAQ